MLSSPEIKRQILAGAETTEIRKRTEDRIAGWDDSEVIKLGNALEAMTRTTGWAYVEEYLIRQMDIPGLVSGGDDAKRGKAKGYMDLMQWIKVMIDLRDKIIAREETGDGK